ncbi:hypothetical protein GWK47_044410 [Chionoecetes opilio]|uniref:Uncharacterized protein n=1 Tax=Chionoecetes opilio TaxID=41210 RepID=A0A8J5CY45_CHIOP|nr:hypothetical protein GWK47_044410 [Chionoecetes opilio]
MGAYAMLRVASVFISVALAFDPVAGDSPLPRDAYSSFLEQYVAFTLEHDLPYRGGSRPAAGGAQTGSAIGTLAGVAAGPAGQFGTAGGFGGASRPTGGITAAGSQGGNSFQGFGGSVDQGGAAFVGGSGGQGFATSVFHQQIVPTVTQTVTVDAFTTLTDTVFQSYGVTLTQFAVQTVTRPIQQVVVTPVDDVVAVATTQVLRPEYITLTETKSDFRLAVRTSVTHVTLTHTSYAITHVPFTITATETVQITSAVVRTVIDTVSRVVTDYRTLLNTVFVHGGYY